MTHDALSTERRRRLGALCLAAAPLVLLASTATRFLGTRFAWTTLVTLWVLLAYGAILALVHLLRERADRLGLVGGILCFIGLTTAAGMMAVYRLGAVLEVTSPDDLAVLSRAFASEPLLRLTIFAPGLSYPLGLLVLSVALRRARLLPTVLAMALAVGAVLFPIGRIAQVDAALLASDLLTAATLLYLSRRVLTRPELWSPAAQVPPAAAPPQVGAAVVATA